MRLLQAAVVDAEAEAEAEAGGGLTCTHMHSHSDAAPRVYSNLWSETGMQVH